MESEIQKLVQSTTIVKVEDYRSGEIIAGDKFYYRLEEIITDIIKTF